VVTNEDHYYITLHYIIINYIMYVTLHCYVILYCIIQIILYFLYCDVLTEVHESLSGCKRRFDLELTSECVWIEILLPDGFNLLVGNHYFSPNTDTRIIENYFNSLEINLNPQTFRVVLLGD
jgi:hypothetical protein